MKLYKYLANQLSRIAYMERNDRDQDADDIRSTVDDFVKANFPRGSGFDAGTHLDWDKSTTSKLVFRTEFHHMNDVGYYDGWTQHEVIVKPSFLFDCDIRITGRDRNQIKDYIDEVFNNTLARDEDFKFL